MKKYLIVIFVVNIIFFGIGLFLGMSLHEAALPLYSHIVILVTTSIMIANDRKKAIRKH